MLGIGEHAHDDDAGSARGQHLIQIALVDAADREPGPGSAEPRRRTGPGRARAPDGPAWSAWATPDPCRSSRPRGSAAAAGRLGRACEDRPMSGCGPISCRATATGRSSWPRCSTSAPHAKATSARSLTASSAPCAAHARRNTSRYRSSWPASRPFCRNWTMSTPLLSTSSRNRGRSPWRSRASVHRYSRAAASRSRRSG